MQSAVDAGKQGDENPNSSMVAETMKLPANSFYGYKIMDWSGHTVTNYLTAKKTHAANISKLFKKLEDVNNSLYENEFTKAQIEQKEPIIVGFFILQHAKLQMLELYRNFFTNFCVVTKFRKLEMDTDSLYLALAEKELEDCIKPEMRAEWQRLRSNDSVNSFTANAAANFFPRTYCVKHKQQNKREPGLFKEEFRCTEMLGLRSKTYCCYDVISNKPEFSSKRLNKRVMEQSGDGPLEEYRRVLNEKVNVTTNNRRFQKNNHSVATYEQVMKSLSYFSFTQCELSRLKEFTLNRLICKIFTHFFVMCFCPNLYILTNVFNFNTTFLQSIKSYQYPHARSKVTDSPFYRNNFPFMAGLSFHGLSIFGISYSVYRLLHIFGQFFLCIATVTLLQSVRLFGIILLNFYSAGVTELYPIAIHY